MVVIVLFKKTEQYSDFLKIMVREIRRHGFQCELFEEKEEHNNPEELFGEKN